MTQKKVLGRGLGALIPAKHDSASALFEIPLDRISPNPSQPRKGFDAKALSGLTSSIREHGIMQPLVVTRRGERYELIAGERRYRAALEAGLKSVPVLVRELASENHSLELALIENIQREDLNPIEEALAYQQLHEEFGMTQEEISKRVGKERSTVANMLRLLKLPEKVKELLAEGVLSMGHARAILALGSAAKQQSLAERVVRRKLNVRQTEQLASETAGDKKKKKQPVSDVFTRDAEEKLTRQLRARVEIQRKRRGGRIVIPFSGEEDLIRIFEELTGRQR